MQEFDLAAERCAGDILDAFSKLNGPGTGEEKTFVEASAMLGRFDDFRRTIENMVRSKTGTWVRHRNGLAPHRLPVELLPLIFHFALFASSGRRRRHYVARLNTLRSVSCLWRDVIDGSPSFWTQLSSQDHIDFVREALQKSQTYPLQLKYVGEIRKEEQSPFWENVFVHLNRWEYVAVQEPHGMLVEKYLSTPAPRLKGLVLSTQTGSITTGPRPRGLLFGEEIAGLEEFRAIRWKDMNWTDVHCHKLRVLEIEDCFWLDMETLFGIIAENLDLRILRIHFVTFRPYTHPSQEREPLILSRLTDFTFTNIAEVVDGEARQEYALPVMRMLRRIQIPACTLFAIEMGMYDISEDMQKEFFRLIPRPIEIFNRQLGSQGCSPKPPAARVTLWYSQFECRAFGKPRLNPGYSLLLGGARSLGLEWTRRELVDGWMETKPSIQLVYWVEKDKYRIDDVFSFANLSNVVELEVTGDPHERRSGAGSGLARGLESPLTASSGAIIGPFLRLKTLHISHFPVSGKEMLKMVKERYARITKPSWEGGSGGEEKAKTPTDVGMTIILGRGMKRFSSSITRDIRATTGVRDIRWDSNPRITDDDPSSVSSDESDWYPQYLESEDEFDYSPEECSSEESEDE
ncbi:hypothetical protein FRC01_006961 [Tulasnella sp. 417]|nr:hypothetical protein FRC01_006961 [Tulasnella sp. 417]